MNKKTWRWAALCAFVVMLVFNGLAGSTTLLNGWNTAAVSDAYPTLFTPAGFTFSIWGVIYLLLLGYTLFQLGVFGKITSDKDAAITKLTPLYVTLSVVNTVWIFAWQYDVIWLALLLIVAMLLLLVRINEILRGLNYSIQEKWLMKAPFSVYFGWITVATVANVSVWLVSIGWSGLGVAPLDWLVVVLWVAAAVGIAGMLRNRDWLYGAVFVWAYCGILWKHLTYHTLFNDGSGQTLANLLVLIVALAMMSGYILRESSVSSQSKSWLKKLLS